MTSSAPVQPTEQLVDVVLQEFRKQIDIHMNTRHPSSSPGHDAMRIALRKGLSAVALAAKDGAVAQPVALGDCPIGLFDWNGELCLKTEYRRNDGRVEAYIVSSGEFFCGGVKEYAELNRLMVTPISTDSLYARPAVEVPPEPETVQLLRKQNKVNGVHHDVLAYIDALRALLDRQFPERSEG